MKKNKKLIMALCFCLGTVMLTTTAFADIASKSGYQQFKDAIKLTSKNASLSFKSYTGEVTLTLKDNGKLLTSTNSISKGDITNKIYEDTTSTVYSNGDKSNNFSYNDPDTSIYNNSSDDTYYVSEMSGGNYSRSFSDPFQSDTEKDIEKIIDAVVGNLKEYVVVNQKSDGTIEFTGSLDESQIPALINAAASFIFKMAIPSTVSGSTSSFGSITIPQMAEDVYIKNVKGKATTDKDGNVISLFTTVVLSGKDKAGVSHDLTLEFLVTLTDINSTSITKPDLTGKKVVISKVAGPKDTTISKKFIGKYKNDIVIDKNDQYVKIGERVVEVTNIKDGKIAGKYTEQYIKGYEDTKGSVGNISFDGSITDPYNVQIQYVDSTGVKQSGNISIDTTNGSIFFNIDYKGANVDTKFSRVFDK